MTCKQLESKLQQLNPTLKLEVKKVTENNRITGKCTTYQLRVEGTKFYIGAFTLKQLVKDIEKKAFNGVLTLQARYGKYETRAIIIDER